MAGNQTGPLTLWNWGILEDSDAYLLNEGGSCLISSMSALIVLYTHLRIDLTVEFYAQLSSRIYCFNFISMIYASRIGRSLEVRLNISITLIVSDVPAKLCAAFLLVQFLVAAGGRLQQHSPCLNLRSPAEHQTARTNGKGEKGKLSDV